MRKVLFTIRLSSSRRSLSDEELTAHFLSTLPKYLRERLKYVYNEVDDDYKYIMCLADGWLLDGMSGEFPIRSYKHGADLLRSCYRS